MRSKRIYYIYLISALIIFPILNSVSALAAEDYVGFQENDEFIWDLTYDEDVDEEMGDDVGINTTFFDIDDDIKAMRVVITWIDKEDSYGGDKGVKTN